MGYQAVPGATDADCVTCPGRNMRKLKWCLGCGYLHNLRRRGIHLGLALVWSECPLFVDCVRCIPGVRV